MKKTALFLLLILTNFSGFSQSLIPAQNLIPGIRIHSEDTLFCFTMPQARILAKHLNHSLYCDSLSRKTDLLLFQSNQLLSEKDSLLTFVNQKSENQICEITDLKTENKTLTISLKQKDKQLRRQRLAKGLFIISTLVLSTALLLK